MLIIFDLDDTLIDTSGSVTPYQLKQALRVLLGRTPHLQEEAELLKLNEKVSRSQLALEQFGKERIIPLEVIFSAVQALSAPLPDDFQVSCTPYAKETLSYYQSRYRLALVSSGQPFFQHEKLKKAGIEVSFFSKIAISEDSVKKPFYFGLAQEFSIDSADIWVCGDRIPMDLLPAHELGFKTIHMRWGRGQKMQFEPWIDHTITDLSQLRTIIQ